MLYIEIKDYTRKEEKKNQNTKITIEMRKTKHTKEKQKNTKHK